MDIAELNRRLSCEGFDPDFYSIDGSLPSYEGLILRKVNAEWKIEHFERGIRREIESFASEEAACNRMYELLTKHFR